MVTDILTLKKEAFCFPFILYIDRLLLGGQRALILAPTSSSVCVFSFVHVSTFPLLVTVWLD